MTGLTGELSGSPAACSPSGPRSTGPWGELGLSSCLQPLCCSRQETPFPLPTTASGAQPPGLPQPSPAPHSWPLSRLNWLLVDFALRELGVRSRTLGLVEASASPQGSVMALAPPWEQCCSLWGPGVGAGGLVLAWWVTPATNYLQLVGLRPALCVLGVGACPAWTRELCPCGPAETKVLPKWQQLT